MLAGKTTSMEVAILSPFYFEQAIDLWVRGNVLNAEIQSPGINLSRSGIITTNFESKNIIV